MLGNLPIGSRGPIKGSPEEGEALPAVVPVGREGWREGGREGRRIEYMPCGCYSLLLASDKSKTKGYIKALVRS